MRVPRRARNVSMSHRLLDEREVGTVANQMRRIRVLQNVRPARFQIRVESGEFQALAKQVVDLSAFVLFGQPRQHAAGFKEEISFGNKAKRFVLKFRVFDSVNLLNNSNPESLKCFPFVILDFGLAYFEESHGRTS